MLETNYNTRCGMNASNTIEALGILSPLPFTIPTILASFMHRSISATYKLLHRLRRDQLVESHLVPELRITVWTITRFGMHTLAAAKRQEGLTFRESRVSRISALTISHELQLQQAHINSNESDNGFVSWTYGHSLKGKLRKRPDAIASDSNGVRTAIELERYPKSKKRIESVMSIYLQEITNNLYDKVAYIAPTEDLAWSLKKLFNSIETVPVGASRYRLEPKHFNKFEFYGLSKWPLHPVE